MKCPSCGAGNQKGKFCAECGAGLDAKCSECGTAVPAGAQFCPSCGAGVGAAAAGGGGGSKAPWIIGAAAIVVVLLVLFLPDDTDRVAPRPSGSTEAPFAGSGGAPGAGGGMGGLSSDMRTNADRLFNRIMMAAEQGNQGEVDQFMPMAIQAYEMVEDLDDDGLYHLGLLQLTAGETAEARRTAQRILDTTPNHVLALGLSATAADEAGDDAAAETLWQRLLDGYDQEAGKPLPEYVDHQNMLGEYRRMAQEATGQ